MNDKEFLKREYIAQNLKKVPFFSGLNPKELEIISSISTIKKAKKGEVIFMEGDIYTGFYCIVAGTVKIYRINKEQRESIIHIVYSLDTFAELPLFENSVKVQSKTAKFPASAMSLSEDAKLIHIPAKEFINLMKDNYLICFGMLSGLSRKLKILQNQVMTVKSLNVTRRLVNYIITEFEEGKSIWTKDSEKNTSNSFTLNIAKIDLASYLGATLETISRTFKKLQDKKLIKLKGRNITILNLNGLKKLL